MCILLTICALSLSFLLWTVFKFVIFITAFTGRLTISTELLIIEAANAFDSILDEFERLVVERGSRKTFPPILFCRDLGLIGSSTSLFAAINSSAEISL